MARNALYAPAHVVPNKTALGNQSQGPDMAPSLSYGGGPGILDSRLPYNYVNSAAGAGALGWFCTMTVNAVPSTLSTTAIAAAQVPVAGTAMTLVSTTGAGITVLAASFLALPSLVTIPSGTLAINGAPGYQRFGAGFFTAFYDYTKMLARNIQIASVGNDSSATFTVKGWDVYGYPQTETITGASGATASGKKCFKFVASITPAGTLSGSNASAGQGDVYDLGITANSFGFLNIVWNGTTVTSSTGFTTADVTSPATATTGGTRGTYAVQSASNGTKKLEIEVQPNIILLNQIPLWVGMSGVLPA